MIELETQFQIVILSILFGMIGTNLYSLITSIFRNSKVFKAILELCFFITFAISYYYFIYILNNGILNVYMPVFLLVGYYLHMKFYDKHFSFVYNCLFQKFSSIIKKRKDRWKKLWKELIMKKIKKPKSTE